MDPPWLEEALGWLLEAAPVLLTGVLGVAVVMLANYLLLGRARRAPGESGRIARQLAIVALAGAAVVALVLALPVDPETRRQLLSLLGVLASAALALSSTTLVGNAVAGLMLRLVGRFRPGDFIQVEGHLGRVTERGLLHVEIQTEDRDLETLPNSFVVSHPLKVVRASGTIVSATVSLGYDVSHRVAERLLRDAVAAAGLEDGFVQILELGDYSVTYRAAGFLAEPSQLLRSRSRVRACMLDALHRGGVEIVSPTYMNQRPLPPDRPVIPEEQLEAPAPTTDVPDDVVFDKAEAAAGRAELGAEREELKARVVEIETQLDETQEAGDEHALAQERDRIQARIQWIDARLAEPEESD